MSWYDNFDLRKFIEVLLELYVSLQAGGELCNVWWCLPSALHFVRSLSGFLPKAQRRCSMCSYIWKGNFIYPQQKIADVFSESTTHAPCQSFSWLTYIHSQSFFRNLLSSKCKRSTFPLYFSKLHRWLLKRDQPSLCIFPSYIDGSLRTKSVCWKVTFFTFRKSPLHVSLTVLELLNLQTIRLKFPQLTTRRLGTRGHSK